jgi:predicted DNA-binding protein (MmcQ/YjbR family)
MPTIDGTMNREAVLAFCLEKPGAWQDEPWEDTVVAKVDERIFCFVGDGTVGVKCGDRDEADEWLLRHPDDAEPMAYIGRSGWNTLRTGRGIPDREILDAVEDSYLMVASRLPVRRRPEGWDQVGKG